MVTEEYTLTVVQGADTTPPAAVGDLRVEYPLCPNPDFVGLTWTAPADDGDDAASGHASEYDLRYSTEVICFEDPCPVTSTRWEDATPVDGEPDPKGPDSPEPGSREGFEVHGLSVGTTYYFAIKTADEVPNWSGPSNVVRGETWPAFSCENAVSPKTFLIAPGETQKLTAIPTGGGCAGYNYSWSAKDEEGSDVGGFVGATDIYEATWQAPPDATDGHFDITSEITDTQTQEACSDAATATISVPGPNLDHVTITPSSFDLIVGDEKGFRAQAYDSDGGEVQGVEYFWSLKEDLGTIAVDPDDNRIVRFTAVTASDVREELKVTATLGDDSVEKIATIGVYEALSCAVSPKTFDIAPNGTRALTATPTGGSGTYTYSWSATPAGGSFEGSTTSSTATWKAPATATNGQIFTITAAVTDSVTQKTCSDSATATIRITAAPTLNISLLMQGRPSYPADSRGSAGIADLYVREGTGDKTLIADDLVVAANGTATNIALSGLSVGSTYDFLLKGYIHLTVLKNKVLAEGSNTLNFGTLRVGDVDVHGHDNKVNAFDYEVLAQGWRATWNDPQPCPDNYANCKLADFNLDSKVNAFDYDYLATNWGDLGDE